MEQLILFTCDEFFERFECTYWSFQTEIASSSHRRIAKPLMISGWSMKALGTAGILVILGRSNLNV
jgi:hypothetical protein